MKETVKRDGKLYTILTGEDASQAIERNTRISRLIRDRGMSRRAAEVVIDAAMFGKGCIPEKYHGKLAADCV